MKEKSFDAVYYSQQVPSSIEALTVLALIFDKVYFPGVYIPSRGINKEETLEELERLKSIGIKDIYDLQLLNCIAFSMNAECLKDFCIFTGQFGYAGKLEDGTREVSKQLEELIYGPPPPGFFPTYPLGFAKALPGDENAGINGPSWITYPANALVYAIKHDLPLINDNASLPVPALGNLSPKHNAKILATIMALESVKLSIPTINIIDTREIMELRHDLKEFVTPFRLEMLKLSTYLNNAIDSNSSFEEINQAARFIYETQIYPQVIELNNYLKDPAKPWYKRVISLGADLVTNFFTMPSSLAIAKTLYAVADGLTDEYQKRKRAKSNGFYYLLRIKKRLSS